MVEKNALLWFVAVLGVLTSSVSGVARAQDDVSARDRQSASQAYTQGTAAYLAEDYATAARWFETAHRLAPAAAALVQAARSYERLGDTLRVATLGLRLSALYPDDPAARRTAAQALRAAPRFVRIDVVCEDCTIQLDEAVMEHPSFFIEPDVEHVVEAAFETGAQRETVQGAAGEQRTLRFEPPPPPPVEPVVAEAPEPLPPSEPVSGGDLGDVPVWVTVSAMVATAAVGGTLIWSGLDALHGVPAYEMNPTPEALADGQAREARTNWLIAGTSVLAATTVLLAIFTNWNENEEAPEEPDVQVSFGVDGDGGTAGLRGRF